MAEWHQPAPQQGGGVDWYSGGGSAQSYAAPAGGAYGGYGGGGGHGSGGGAYGSFEDEPPLLEELGIDIPAILSRTRNVLTFKLGGSEMADLDVGGPLIFMAALGFAHLLVGKMHFGYILGWMVVGSGLLWFVLNSIMGSGDPDAQALDVYSCCCLLGYALLPLVGHAALALLIPRRSVPSMAVAALAVLWSGQTAATLFCRRSPLLDGQQAVVLYPCVLMYSTFALLSLY